MGCEKRRDGLGWGYWGWNVAVVSARGTGGERAKEEKNVPFCLVCRRIDLSWTSRWYVFTSTSTSMVLVFGHFQRLEVSVLKNIVLVYESVRSIAKV